MSKFVNQGDGSYIEVGNTGAIGAKVVDDTEDFGISAYGAPPVTCEEIYSESECTAQGCYWYNGACHSQPPGVVCADLTSSSECLASGCHWYDDACHSQPPGVPPEYEMPWAIIIAAVGGIIAVISAIVLIRRR